MSDEVLIGEAVVTGDSPLAPNGSPFFICGVLMGDGVLMTEGVATGDGNGAGDGVVMAALHAAAAHATFCPAAR